MVTVKLGHLHPKASRADHLDDHLDRLLTVVHFVAELVASQLGVTIADSMIQTSRTLSPAVVRNLPALIVLPT
jgi:hypothetical protein